MKNLSSTDHIIADKISCISENALEVILSNTDHTFILLDKELKIVYANNSTIKIINDLFGYKLVFGNSIMDMVAPQRKQALKELYKEVLNGETRTSETEITLRNGIKKTFENVFKPAKNNLDEVIGILVSSTDITDKKLSETRLKEFGNQYKLLFQNNPLPTWIFDLNTFQFIAVNDQAVKHFGYSRKEFLQMTIFDIHPVDKIEEIRNFITSNKSASNILTNWKQVKKNGENIWVNRYASQITYNGIEAQLVIIDDITTKMVAEKELQKSNERFLLASKATSDAVYDWDLITNKVVWGEGLHTLFGYTASLTIKEWEQLVHEDDRSRVVESLTNCINHKKRKHWAEQYRFKNSNGTYHFILEKGFIVRDAEGKPLRMIGAMQDITDQKIKEQQLLESNERFDIVMKATHDLIWDWNLETGIFYRDTEGLKKVYGIEDEKIIQNIFYWLQRIHPDDHDHVQKVINDILHAKEQNTFDVEYRFKRDDGTYTYVYDRGILLRNSENKPIRMIGAAQDITERKKLELELLEKELEKQKHISQATIETQEQERAEIGKELHDNVNQVLTTTKLYLELAQGNPELKDDLVAKSGKNIIYVINEIRQLSRSLMNPSIGDLGLLDSINDLVENINFTGKLKVTLNADYSIESVLSDNYKLMIYRIIQEAVSNSIKHSSATELCISLMQVENNIQLNIYDNGVGFNQKTVKKGAGLNNIQNRVYIANGTLSIVSEDGKGCRLKINFPIKTINPI